LQISTPYLLIKKFIYAMKRNILKTASLCLLASAPMSAQTKFDGTDFHLKDSSLHGSVILGKSYHGIVDGTSSATCELTAPKGGGYNLNLWAMPALYPSTEKFPSSDGNYYFNQSNKQTTV
jgi:hypothetical protein